MLSIKVWESKRKEMGSSSDPKHTDEKERLEKHLVLFALVLCWWIKLYPKKTWSKEGDLPMLENGQLSPVCAGSCLQLLSTPGVAWAPDASLGCVQWLPADTNSLVLGVGAEGTLSVHGSKNRVFSWGRRGRERSANRGVSPVLILFFQAIVGCCVIYAKLLF